MDWANEPWIKRYTRKTPEDLLLSWQARFVWNELLIEVNRIGELQLGRCGVPGLAAILRIPIEIAEIGLRDLTADGRVTLTDGVLLIPNFVEAQKARKSEAQKKRDQRSLQRALQTQGDCKPGSERSNYVPRNVVRGTECKNQSPDIYSSLISSSLISSDLEGDQTYSGGGTEDRGAPPSLGAPILEVLPGGLQLPAEPVEPADPATRARRAAQLARHAIAALNEATGRGFIPAASATLAAFEAILVDIPDLTEAQVSAVVHDKFQQWADNPDMAQYLRPGTLFARDNFIRYLGDVGTRPSRAPTKKRDVRVGHVPYQDGIRYESGEEF